MDQLCSINLPQGGSPGIPVCKVAANPFHEGDIASSLSPPPDLPSILGVHDDGNDPVSF